MLEADESIKIVKLIKNPSQQEKAIRNLWCQRKVESSSFSVQTPVKRGVWHSEV